MSNILEMTMLICFGASWPINLVKALKAGTAKGTSLPFFLLIEFGYLCGIAAKIISGNITYVIAFYILNILVVGANVAVFFRNRRLDEVRAEVEAQRE